MDEAANQSDKAKPGAAAQPAQRVSLFGGRRKSGNGNGNGAGKPAPPKPPRRPRGFGLSGLSGLLTFVLVIGLLGVAVLVWSVVESRKPGPLAEDKIVVIDARGRRRHDRRPARARRRHRQRAVVLGDDAARRQPQLAEARRIRFQSRRQPARGRGRS